MTSLTTWTTLPERQLLHLEPDQIIFENRAREHYEDLGELAESLKEKGVIQTLAVQATEDPQKFRLLAGGRRYTAAVMARLRPLPALVFPADMSDLDRKEVELFENIHRQSLTWQEEARLVREINALMIQKYGTAVGGGGGQEKTGHSQADTARLLGKERSTVTKSIQRAEGLDKHPELATARNASEADRILKNIERRRLAAKAAAAYEEEAQTQSDEEAAKRKLAKAYWVGDFFELVKEVPDDSAQIIELDPPYGIDLDAIKFKDTNISNTEGYTEVPEDEYLIFMRQTIKECIRVLRYEGWLLCWHAYQWQYQIRVMMEEAGLIVCPIPAYWVKPTTGQTNHPEYCLGSSVEPFFYARRGRSHIIKQGRSNVFEYVSTEAGRKSHPTERPVELMQEILSTFAHPNCNVFVPFLGSGNTILAASNAGMYCFGMDLDKDDIYRNAFVQKVQEGRIRQYSSYTP